MYIQSIFITLLAISTVIIEHFSHIYTMEHMEQIHLIT